MTDCSLSGTVTLEYQSLRCDACLRRVLTRGSVLFFRCAGFARWYAYTARLGEFALVRGFAVAIFSTQKCCNTAVDVRKALCRSNPTAG